MSIATLQTSPLKLLNCHLKGNRRHLLQFSTEHCWQFFETNRRQWFVGMIPHPNSPWDCPVQPFQGVSKVCYDYFFAQISLIIKIPFVKLSKLFIIHFSSTIIQMVSRGITSHEFAGWSPYAIKFPSPCDTMSACAPPFSLQGFPTFAGHISSYRCQGCH